MKKVHVLTALLILSTIVSHGQMFPKVWTNSISATAPVYGVHTFAVDDNAYIFAYEHASAEANYGHLMNVDSTGIKRWDVGIADADVLKVILANDGGFIGFYNLSNDLFVFKVDNSGNVMWRKQFGGTGTDVAVDVVSMGASNYLVLATSNSNSSATKTENSKGGNDYWAIKLDNNGNKVWDKTLGTAGDESALQIFQRSANNFILDGGVGSGHWLVWITKNGTSGKNLTVPADDDFFGMVDFTHARIATNSVDATFIYDSTFVAGRSNFKLITFTGSVVVDIAGYGSMDAIENAKVLLDNRVMFTAQDYGVYIFDGEKVVAAQDEAGPIQRTYSGTAGYTPSLNVIDAFGNIGPEPGHVTVTRHRAPNKFVPVFYYSLAQHNLPYNGTHYFLNTGCRWADLDNNGVLDFMIYQGEQAYDFTNAHVHTFFNSGGNFNYQKSYAINVGSPPFNWSNTDVSLGDYNQDGYVDFASFMNVYLNNKSKDFVSTPINYGPTNILNWGDVDQDGDYDLIVEAPLETDVLINNGQGQFASRVKVAADDAYVDKKPVAVLAAVQKRLFTSTDAGDPMGPDIWESYDVTENGDYDNDSDNDVLAFNKAEVIIYQNRSPAVNQRPTVPANLAQSINGSSVTFTWSASTDDNTTAPNITYNIYLRKDLDTLISFNSFRKTGVRKIVNPGNVAGTSYTFNGTGVGTYYWSVQAVDGTYRGSFFANEQNFFITHNPTNIALSNATIPENSAAAIGTLSTTDQETDETYSYSLVAGTGSTDNALFKITGTSLSPLSATSLNFESKSSYSIRIRTTDSRQGTFEKVFTITVTNVQESATDITLTATAIPENQAAGTTVGTFGNNDPDAGDTFTYTLVSGTGSTDNASFTISGNLLKSAASFNYEVKNSYGIRVQTKDQAGNLFQKAFVITVTDINDLAKPVLNAPTAITQSGFTLGWSVVEGATSYEVDISSNNFSTLVSGYNPAVVSSTSLAVINLTAGTTYQIRIRALESTYKSVNSDVVQQITVPPTPTALDPPQLDATSFDASWSASTGATKYELELSAGAGTFTPMAGYNPKIVTGATDQLITGLTQNSIYKYRVRAVNAGGTSPNSNEKSIQTTTPNNTKPIAQPTNLVFTGITTTTLAASFTAAVGTPDGYLILYRTSSSPADIPVDGVSYTAGSALGASVVAYSGASASFSLNALAANTVYFFAVFSYKEAAGSRSYLTTSPLANNHTTLANQPTTQPTSLSFSSVTTSSLTGTFTLAASSPTGYLVIRKSGSAPTDTPSDGTVYPTGSSLGTSSIAYSGTGSTFNETSLSAGTSYYYTIFAFNGDGGARNYLESTPLTGSAVTIPNAPVAKPPTNVTQATLTANWDASTGASTYQFDISNDNFATSATSTGITGTEFSVTGLVASTDYKYRLRAVNSSGGVSQNSNSITARTADQPVNALKITTAPSTSTFPPNTSSVKVTITVTGGAGAKTVNLKYRGVLADDFNNLAMTVKSGDDYEAQIDASLLDELGIEFIADASDETGTHVTQQSSSFLYKSVSANSQQIPFAAGFTGKTSTYQMFSIPYQLSERDVNKIFDVSLGGYDNTKWRMFHYTAGDYKEYPTQFLEFNLGEGYWFNTILDPVAIKIGAATVGEYSPQTPFAMDLHPGWNQIGNPYPFKISWAAVTAGTSGDIGGLKFWSGGSYVDRDVLKPWEGAFVFNSNANNSVALLIPLSAKTTGGRVGSNPLGPAIDQPAWKLNMELSVGDLHATSGVGMHPDARTAKDRYDEIALPRFADYLEMHVNHPEFFAPFFTTDVVPTSETQAWTFELASNLNGDRAELKWDQAAIRDEQASMILIDLLDKVWIDMKVQGTYSFIQKEGREFRIVYNRNGEFAPGVTVAGACYPNPFIEEVRIPLLLEKKDMTMSVNVYNLLGQRVKTITRTFSDAGFGEFLWDGRDDQGHDVASGILLYRVGEGEVMRMIKR